MHNSPPRRHQYATPLHIDRHETGGTALALERVQIGQSGEAKDSYSERWLQELIFHYPQALPIAEIDPGIGTLVPICIELQLKSGAVDNIFLTGDGDIVVVECKLWRNPEARREVVGQIIDYAHSMASWTYADLNAAVQASTTPDGHHPTGTVYEIVAGSTDIDEIRFVDAVSRNLRLGRLLLLLVGDGIREGAETLSDYLQLHAGFHFTLGLVEMPIYRLPAGGFIVQPRILARTVNIERGIVRIDDARLVVDTVTENARPISVRTSLSQERIIESIAERAPDFPAALKEFAAAADQHGVFIEPATKSLMVRWPSPDGDLFTVGAFDLIGNFVTGSVGWRPNGLGLLDVAHGYLAKVAALVGGSVKQTPTPDNWYVVIPGGKLPDAMTLLNRRDEWLMKIVEYGQALNEAMQTRTG